MPASSLASTKTLLQLSRSMLILNSGRFFINRHLIQPLTWTPKIHLNSILQHPICDNVLFVTLLIYIYILISKIRNFYIKILKQSTIQATSFKTLNINTLHKGLIRQEASSIPISCAKTIPPTVELIVNPELWKTFH